MAASPDERRFATRRDSRILRGYAYEEIAVGTWSHEPFCNDSANDWAYGLEEHTDFSLVVEAIQNVLATGDDYLDADLAEEAIAAAEVLATSIGRGTQRDGYTKKVETWLASITAKPAPGLLTAAQHALARILDADSELRELWEESDDFASWESSVKALQAALQS